MWNLLRRLRASRAVDTEPEMLPCRDCLLCVKACPAGALTYTNRMWKLDVTACFRCGECAEVCPNELISVRRPNTA